MLMMKSYIDDSGKGQQPVFVLAGYIASAEKWALFSERWKETLGNKPSLKYFKMKEAANLKKQFANWTEDERNKRLKELVKIIKEYASLGIQCVVNHNDYNDVIKNRIAKPLNDPYWFSFYNIIIALYRHHIDNPFTTKIDWVFDEQFKQSDQVQASWSGFIKFIPDPVKSILGSRPIHQNDKLIMPLQAADMIAWTVRRFHYEVIVNKKIFSPVWMGLSEMWEDLSTISYIKDIWDKDRLLHFMDITQRVKREAGRVFPYDL